jgi:nucleoside-triphosphatase
MPADFLEALKFAEHETGLVIIDEIGKMECYSEKFRKLVKDLLDSGKPVIAIATIAQKGGGFISEVEKRGDISLFDLTQSNRTMLSGELAHYAKTL